VRLLRKKKNRVGEPNCAEIHINVEKPKGNSPAVILNSQKCHFFLIQKQKTRGQIRSFLGSRFIPRVVGRRWE
jgi:hypothetical protein